MAETIGSGGGMTRTDWVRTDRFALRPLSSANVTPCYLGWLHQAAGGAIESGRSDTTLAQLHDYVSARLGRDDVLFLGIFTRDDDRHIGNLKFEPIDREVAEAVMGILIGEVAWRGCGVASEILPPACNALCRSHGVRQVSLGVARTHAAAQAAYRRAGFAEGAAALVPDGPDRIVMVRSADR